MYNVQQRISNESQERTVNDIHCNVPERIFIEQAVVSKEYLTSTGKRMFGKENLTISRHYSTRWYSTRPNAHQ
jgi:hypothetical protein